MLISLLITERATPLRGGHYSITLLLGKYS